MTFAVAASLIGRLNCTWARFNEAMEKVKKHRGYAYLVEMDKALASSMDKTLKLSEVPAR